MVVGGDAGGRAGRQPGHAACGGLFGGRFPEVAGGDCLDLEPGDSLQHAPHIIVATPGRLIDLIERGKIKLQNINFLVLDEADEMLNMGFKEDIEKILE